MPNDINSARHDHGPKKKTPFQVQSLEKYYSEEKYPKPADMEEYAAFLKLPYKQVRTWFVESRRKQRRENEAHDRSPNMDVNFATGESRLISSSGSGRQNNKQMRSENLKRCSSAQGDMMCNTSSKCQRSCNSAVSDSNWHTGQDGHLIRPQVLVSKDFILKRVFRKDGPPLGLEFDSLPSSSGVSAESGMVHSGRDRQRVLNKRKMCSPTMEVRSSQVQNVPSKKYGIGKGLMTVWRATNPCNVKRTSVIKLLDGNAAWMPFKSSSKEKQLSRRIQQLKLVPKKCVARRKINEKRKPLMKRKKMPCHKGANQQKHQWKSCKLSIEELAQEHSVELTQLIDDEELELRELQAGPNPLRCSVHFALDGRHDCPLCKDLLAKFPPQTVKMKTPLSTRPWSSSPELVRKLFKVLRFLYSNAATIEVCPFTIDELSLAFTDKDSMLLGKIHVALLKLLLADIQKEVADGIIPRASKKDGRFLGLFHFVREQEIDVNIWTESLNALTWTEILRQVLVAAGYGAKSDTARRELFSKERTQMAKYGLRPRTLKGELFKFLSDRGSSGIKVSDLLKASQIIELDLPNSDEEIEQLICSTLSSDITLFEKIAPSAYRLRINPDIKGKEDYQSDSDDSGSVDDDSGVSCSSSSNDESDSSEELSSERLEQRIVKYGRQHKRTGTKLTESTEIDDSYSGEACVLGLMEGEYSDLSIDEKLDALIALVDLTEDCSSLQLEEYARAITPTSPNIRHRSSGAKIKKLDHNRISQGSEIASEAPKKQQSSTAKSSVNKDNSGLDRHSMQSIFLGFDRRYNSYWLFLGPCDIIDPGHRQVYFESSEDGHWEVISTAQALDALLSALDCRGVREACLFASLDKREAFLCQAMDDYITAENVNRQTIGLHPSEGCSSGDGSSPISDIDNIVDPVESSDNRSATTNAVVLEIGKSKKEKKQKWDRLQAFDKWLWNDFYSNLNTVRKSKRPYMESLARCESCHDLYWRDEKHCRICHATFELDFDLEEKYAIHIATCRSTEDNSEFPKHRVLSSQLQSLKAASHAIEAVMPDVALSAAWTKSTHKLWVKRLKRTSTLPEFLQVLADFVGAINESWLCECALALGNTAVDEMIVDFQTMPQTTSAVALWMTKLDAVIAPQLVKAQPEQALESMHQGKRRRISTM